MDEEEEQESGPAKYEFSTESKLDEDHLFYLQFTNNFISNVTRPRDFDHCTKWLERLAGEPMYGIEAKRNRNMYLAQLLIAMQDNKVKGPFSTFPPNGPLPSAAVAFGLSSEEDVATTETLFYEPDRELNMNDYKYESEDGRLYVATCALPKSSGVMSYIGLTFGGGEGLWLNKEGHPIKSEDVVGDEERVTAITTSTPIKKQWELLKEYMESLKSGGEGEVKTEEAKTAEDAYQFLINLPESRSDADLLEVGSYKINKLNVIWLEEIYPAELVNFLQELMVKSKKDIERRYRSRHNRILTEMYESYGNEIEKGLLAYKEARQEWQSVYDVLAEIKETMSLKEIKDTEIHTASGPSLNKHTAQLVGALEGAKKRVKEQYKEGQNLEAKKTDLHKDVHDRALYHLHELEKLNAQVDKLVTDICNLRRENRKKQQVIRGLNMSLENV